MGLYNELDRIQSITGGVHVYLYRIFTPSAFSKEVRFVLFADTHASVFNREKNFVIQFMRQVYVDFSLPGVFYGVFNEVVYGFFEPKGVPKHAEYSGINM